MTPPELRPLWVVSGEQGPRRRLLLISYHFPPGEGTGALRWQKMSHHAAERGWGLDVVTLHPSELAISDPGRLEDLPPGTRIFGVAERRLAVERAEGAAHRLYRALRPRRRRGASATPPPGAAAAEHRSSADSVAPEEIRWDLRHPRGWKRAYYAWLRYQRDGSWAARAARAGCELARANPARYDAILTSGPPHMAHDAGRRIAARTGLPLIVDLRDPWSIRRPIHAEYASPLYFRLADRYERAAVKAASLMVANTEALQRAMQDRYPGAADRIIAAMNGYDEDQPARSAKRDGFVIAYTGILYLRRDPRLLFRAAARVVRELRLLPEQFRFEFLGDTTAGNGVPIETIAREEGLEGYVRARPRRPRGEALELLAEAALLLVYPHNSLAIPSKVYEYMRYDAWLLALAEPGSPTETILRDTGADVLAPQDLDAMTRLLRERYQQFAAGERPPPLRNVEQFSRRNQARILFDALEAALRVESLSVEGGSLPTGQ